MTEPEIVIEDAPILEAPIEVKAIAVETPKAEPVKIKSQTSSKPKAITVNNKPLKKVDARVTQARTLMNNNDYAAALDMYEAVLAADPTSTPALTGRQLAKAKMRMTVNTPTIAVESSKPHTSAPIEPIEPMVASELDGLISTMNANPRDAQSVLAVAEYYGAQGDKASAVAFYRKALQLDMIYKSGIDRTAISAAITAVQ
jgi:tetratricopeptide (TPR) repeat protein